MNVPDQHQEAVRRLLHDTVDHLDATPGLAQRVEVKARRRRAARWSSAGVAVVVGVGTLTGLYASGRAAPTAVAQLPSCAARVSAYEVHVSPSDLVGAADAGPAVPGHPVAAVLCRYAGMLEKSPGTLLRTATVTDRSELARLQSAVNATTLVTGAVNCPQMSEDPVVLQFSYPGGAVGVTAVDSGTCPEIQVGTVFYLIQGDFGEVVADLVGTRGP